MAEGAVWSWTDGWVLASIILSRRSGLGDLVGLLNTADYINRGVLSRDEIETAVNRLRSAGLLALTEFLDPLPLAESLWKDVEGGGSPVASIKRLVVLMNTRITTDKEASRWELRQDEYQEAVDRYRDSFL